MGWMSTFDAAALVLVLAAVIGLINDRWIGIPRNIALLLGALAVAGTAFLSAKLLGHDSAIMMWRDRLDQANLSGVLLQGVLALLWFAGSLHVDVGELRARAWTIASLATLGVIAATVLFGLGFYLMSRLVGLDVPLVWCAILGALVAPTDAVVVEALLRPIRVPGELRAILSGESLFNDGAAVVVFLSLLAIAAGEHKVIGSGYLAAKIAAEVLGGGALGWIAGLAAALSCRRVSDRSLELTVTLALALASYRIAVALGVSGPIAVVTAGLAWAQAARRSDRHGQVATSWSVIDDLLNTLLFILMGFQFLAVPLTPTVLLLLPIVFALSLATRALSVAPAILTLRMPLQGKLRGVGLLTWSGLRGGISIALALTLPETPWRDLVLAIGYAVVIMTIVIQGLSIAPVLGVLYRSHPGGRASRD